MAWNKVTVNNADGGLNVHIAGGASITAVDTVADGADVTLGSIADAAVTGDLSGTVNAHLRGITKQLAGTVAVSIASMPSTPVTGTFWQSTQPVSNAGTFVVQATLAAETTKVIGTVNVAAAQTIAVTNVGTFAVQATLSAETTKVIGVVRTADGSGNLLTSTAAALDINIKSGNPTTIAVTNTGTFAVQAALNAETTKVIGTVNIAASQTIAVTNTGTFVVQATLAAETTKVIGTVNQGTSPWVTSRNWTLASGTDSVSAVQGTAAAVASAWPIKVTDGINTVGIATGTGGASELLTDRMKVNAELRLLDTAQTAGGQLVAAKGDQTSGLWVNTKSSALPTNASIETGGQLQQIAELLQALVIETRIHTLLLQQGLNVNDDIALFRSDPFFLA